MVTLPPAAVTSLISDCHSEDSFSTTIRTATPRWASATIALTSALSLNSYSSTSRVLVAPLMIESSRDCAVVGDHSRLSPSLGVIAVWA